MKTISEEEYNELKRGGMSAIRTATFTVGKEYEVQPKKGYICNGVAPLNGEPLQVKCTQNMPHVLKTLEHIKQYTS